jgi:opacity protein-like surface antigen
MPRFLLLVCCVLAGAAPLAAQVGHEPRESPYRELPNATGISALGAYFDGGGGTVGVGPHDGWMYGARFQVRSNRSLSLGVGVLFGDLQRRLLDPKAPAGERDKGMVQESMIIPEAVITMNLTGGKTWHRMAPYLGFGAGAAIGGNTPADSSGYDFGTKFSFAPFAGLRIHPIPSLAIRGEIRGNLWKLSYPISYRTTADDGTVIIADGAVSEWQMSPVYVFGLSFYF